MVSTSPFVKQTSFGVQYAPAHITKWRSERTGLQVTYINQPSPIVNGYFAVATEITNDSGCPHTLEHLVFLGSKKYPYKGLLDTLGNRLFSSTNAWTAVDQTVYTLTTAGWEGFKALLPVYLDHLFHPTLKDEACLTEVYHIDGKGKEKGVVFSEMQGIESQSWFVTFLEMQRTLYAKDSGYSSETGGLMSELRHLTNKQIQEYHQSSYRPDNLCAIITGSVDEDELMNIMTKFDNELSPLPETPNARPFVDSKPDGPLSGTIVKEVDFPEKDESMGEVIISWIGPKADENLVNVAIDVLGSYFTDSAISLFNKHLVEIENPLANEIDYGTDDYLRTGINFTISSVPTEHLRDVDNKIKELLKEQTVPRNLDLKYMKQIINQQKLKYISSTEKSAQTFANIAISEFIYGNPDSTDLSKWTKDLKEHEELESWTAEQWCEVIKEYFVDNHSATILGKPSAKLNKLIKQKNKAFSKSIKEKYGVEGLKKLQDEFDHAQSLNNEPIPEEIITLFERPDPANIQFIETESYKAGADQINGPIYVKNDPFNEVLLKDTPENFPLAFHFENYKSQFTTINLLSTSTVISPALLRYMSIIEEIFSMSIQLPNDGKYIPYDEVISEINNDLIEFSLDNGFDGQFYELINVKVKFENTNYAKAVNWLLNVLKHSIFEETRVKIIIEKIVNSLPEKKRNGELMMYSSQYRKLYTENSLRKSQDSIYTETFYKGLLEKINNGGFKDIQKDLNTLRSQLFNIDNFKVVVVGNAKQLESPISTWKNFVDSFKNVKSTLPGLHFENNLPRAYQFKSEIGERCSSQAFITTVPSTESSYLISMTPMPTDYNDGDIFKISLAAEFLRALEGPLYKGIRGTGLAYGATVRQSVETGYLSFSIYRGTDAKQAWIAGKKAIDDYTNGTLEIDYLEIQSSIAGIVNGIAEAESNAYDAANGKFSDDILKKRGPNFINLFLEKLNKITPDDVVYILKKYYKPLFEPKSTLLFACLPPSKSSEFKKFLLGKGYEVEIEEIGADVDSNESGGEGCCSGHDHDHHHDHNEESESETESESELESGSESESESESENESESESENENEGQTRKKA